MLGTCAQGLVLAAAVLAAAPGPAAGPPGSRTSQPPSDGPRPPAPPTGNGMILGGALAVWGGAVLTIAGAIGLARAGQETEAEASGGAAMLGIVGLGVGGAMVVAGTPLLVVGLMRHRTWKAWQAEHRVVLRPSVARGARGTWTMGLELRF